MLGDYESIEMDSDFITEHREPSILRLLALGVLLQALEDAKCEAKKRIPVYKVEIRPLPSVWIGTEDCRTWCEAAGVNYYAFRERIIEVMTSVRELSRPNNSEIASPLPACREEFSRQVFIEIPGTLASKYDAVSV